MNVVLTICHFQIIIKFKNQLYILKTALRYDRKDILYERIVIIKASEIDKKNCVLMIKVRLLGFDKLNFTKILKIIRRGSFILQIPK